MMTPTPVSPPQYAPLQRQMRHLSPPNHDGHHSTSHPRCRWTWPLFLLRSLPLAITRTAMALFGSLVALLVPLMAHLVRLVVGGTPGIVEKVPRLLHLALWHGLRCRHQCRHATPDVWAWDQRRSETSGNSSGCLTHHRQADGLNFDLLNRSRLALHVCWQNRWWTHWRWKIGFRISPRYITLQRIAQACRRDRHCACVAPTTHIAGRSPQSFRWIKANWAAATATLPPSTVWEDPRHTHSLPDAHPQHRHSRERQTFLWSTVAHNRCPCPQLWVGFSCDSQMVPVS